MELSADIFDSFVLKLEKLNKIDEPPVVSYFIV